MFGIEAVSPLAVHVKAPQAFATFKDNSNSLWLVKVFISKIFLLFICLNKAPTNPAIKASPAPIGSTIFTLYPECSII